MPTHADSPDSSDDARKPAETVDYQKSASPAVAATLAPPQAAGGEVINVVAAPGYEILGLLGRGGMGVVYKARQIKADRVVALKMILHVEHASDEQRERFQTEARAIARLQHPHIIQIHEVGEHRGIPFFSLEFCAGGGLDQKLAGTPLEAKAAGALVERLARAMDAAHQVQIIHRDLKPANVLLTADGEPKITDFGLAKRLDVQGRTQTGALIGTPSYMAPEQAGGGKDVGPTADVYALGAILYECLTGRPPFKAATMMDTIKQVVSDDPVPPRQLQSKMPKDVETICLKCLHKEASKRYATAAQLAEDLGRFQRGEPILARPVGRLERGWSWCRRNPAVAGLLTGLSVILLAGTIVSSYFAVLANDRAYKNLSIAEQARQAQEKAEISARQAIHRLYAAQMHRAEKASQEGHFRRLRELLEEQKPEKTGGTDLRGFEWYYWMRMADPALLSYHGHQNNVVHALAFSPDGRRVASASWDETVQVWDPISGKVDRTLTGHTGGVRGVAYSPDGRRLISGGDSTLRFWDFQTGQQLRTLSAHAGGVECLSLSSDGRLLVSGGAADRRAGEVKLWDAGSGQLLATFREPTQRVAGVAISPDGQRVAAGSLDGAVYIWNTVARKLSHVLLRRAGVVRSVAFSPDGRHLASGNGDGTIKIWNPATGRFLRSLEGHNSMIESVAYSADGKLLASAAMDWTARVWDVSSGRQIRLFGMSTITGRCVAFRPDGRCLAGADDCCVKIWDVTRDPSVLAWQAHAKGSSDLSFSPDGLRFATGGGDGAVKIWDTISGRQVDLMQYSGFGIVRVSFRQGGSQQLVASDNGNGTVSLVDPTKSKERTTWSGFRLVVLSRDGNRFAGLDSTGKLRVVDVQSRQEFPIPTGPLTIEQLTTYRTLALNGDGSILAVGGDFASVQLWDVRSNQLRRQLLCCPPGFPLHLSFAIFALAIDSTNRQIAVGTFCGEIQIWDMDTGRQIQSLRGHDAPLTAMAFSPDGKRLASASEDRTLRLWDTSSGQEVFNVFSTNPLTCLAFSPDGSCLACADRAGMVQVRTSRQPSDKNR